jgi:hypothetical protein
VERGGKTTLLRNDNKMATVRNGNKVVTVRNDNKVATVRNGSGSSELDDREQGDQMC